MYKIVLLLAGLASMNAQANNEAPKVYIEIAHNIGHVAKPNDLAPLGQLETSKGKVLFVAAVAEGAIYPQEMKMNCEYKISFIRDAKFSMVITLLETDEQPNCDGPVHP